MDTTRILTISRLTDCLCIPVKASTRLKYSSVAVSSSVICLGTNTGSTYVFDRETFKLIKFISSKGGNVEILEFSKDGKLLAIADSGGTVTCLEIDEEKHSFKVLKEIEDHKGSKLTALCWDDDSARLFIGDDRGIVTAVIVTPYKLPAGKFLSKSSVEIVIKGESPIIQLDYAKVKLLISTTTRTLLCLTDRSKYQQVGSKPRDGRFGSCFLQYVDGEFPVIYAARPGSRLWEVDFNGQVLATHQFKYLLGVPPKKLFGHNAKFLNKNEENWDKPQSLAFPRLQQLCNRYLVSWSQNGLYILDPSLGKVAAWFDQIKGIKDICCHNESVFVLLNDGQVAELEFLPVKKCLKTLIAMTEYKQAAQVAVEARDEILNHVESFLTIDFDYILENLQTGEDDKLHGSLKQLIDELQVKHDLVRSEIQERLNRIANLDDSNTPCDSGVEDNDEIRSNHSEVGSETSSRLSLTRLPQIDVDSVLRKATSAVVNKIVSSGFMKKALKEVLEADVNLPNDHAPRSPLQLRKFTGTIQTEAAPLSAVSNRDLRVEGTQLAKEVEMGNQEIKILNTSVIDNGEVDGNIHSARSITHTGKRRKKAKVVTLDFESPQKDKSYTQPAYDVLEKMHMRRNLSLGATIPYAPHADLKRLSSDPYESDKDIQAKLQNPSEQSPSPKIPTILKQAKQLVRNIIHHESPAPLDVGSHSTTSDDIYKDRQFESATTCLLTSQEALRYIPKFVDVTAVCRNKIRDSRVLFNSKTVRKIFQEWAEKLNETMNNFTKAFTNDIKQKNKKHKFTDEEVNFLIIRTREEFFSSLGAAFSEVSNLASLCFETGIFPIACSKLSSLDFSIIDHSITFNDIRREVNEMLNKDDEKDGILKPEVPQETAPSTLLSIANDYFESKGDEGSDSLLGKSEDVAQNRQAIAEELDNLQGERVRPSNDFSTETEMDNNKNKGRNARKLAPNITENDAPCNKEITKIDESTSNITSVSQTQQDSISSTLNEYVEISESATLLTDKRKTFLPVNIESVLCTTHEPITCQSCAEDICRACFVLWYFPLLDLHKIRTVLCWKRGCRWRTWLAFLVHLEDIRSWQELKSAIRRNDYGKVARILRDSTTTESFFSCLRRIFSFSPHLVLDFCTEKDINPWEVSFIYMANSENSDALDDFLGYISALKRIKPSLNLYEDISVAMTTLYCGLKQSAVSNTMNSCDCGGARKGAHLLSWRWKNHVDDVIDWLLKVEDAESGIIHRVLKLCREYGYWFGCVQVFRHRRDHRSSFELLCQLGDFQLLDNYIKKDTFTITEHDLEYLFQLKCHTTTADGSIKCQPAVPDFTPNISSECIARVLVRELGVKTALKILERFRNTEHTLLGNFYYDCMRVAEKDMEQRFIATKIMEKLNNDICDENKSVIDKHIELLKNKELDGYSDIIDESLDEIDVSNKLWDSTSSNHWGVGLSLSSSNCPCCTLPLCIHGSSASAGLVVFECGHTFHKQCIPEEACLMCYYDLEKLEDNFN